LGESLAKAYANEETTLLLTARNMVKLKELQAQLPGEIRIYQADLTKLEEIGKLVRRIEEENEEVDILINNAGIGFFSYFSQTNEEEIIDTIQVNTVSLMLLTRRILEMMPNGSTIINIASIAGKLGTSKSSVYAASKSAVISFSNVLRMELTKQKIHVLCANFGPFRTPFHEKADQSGQYAKKIDRFMLEPDDLAQAIVKAQVAGKNELNRPRSMQAASVFATLFPRAFAYLSNTLFNFK